MKNYVNLNNNPTQLLQQLFINYDSWIKTKKKKKLSQAGWFLKFYSQIYVKNDYLLTKLIQNVKNYIVEKKLDQIVDKKVKVA